MNRDDAAVDIAIGLATLAAAGATTAVALTLFVLPADQLQDFFVRNALDHVALRALMIAFGAGATVGLVPGIALLASKGARVQLARLSALSSPLILAAILPVLRTVEVWRERPLPFLVLLALGTLFLERSAARVLELAPSRSSAARNLPEGASRRVGALLAIVLVSVASLAYATFIGTHTILRHWRFETSGFDLGIQDNLMWTAMHGEPFRSTIVLPDGTSFLSHHAEFLSLLFVPIYALRPGAETLLLFQAIYFGCAALPLYAFAESLLPRWIAVVLALAYLLYAPMHGPNFYDFHWLPFSIPLFFALFWSISTRRFRIAWALVACLLLLREDVSLGLAALGAFLFVTRLEPRFGGSVMVLSLLWFLVIKMIVMPWFGAAPFLLLHRGLVPPGETGYGSVIRTILFNPAFVVGTLLEERKLVYALHLLAPMAFVPLRRASFLLLLLPGLFITLLTTGYAPTVQISFQYTAHWIPFLFGATVLYLRHLEAPVRRNAAAVAIFVGVLAHSYQFGAVLQQKTFVGGFGRVGFDFSEEHQDRLERFHSIVAHVPEDASLAATDPEVPHLSTRRTIYTLGLANPGAEYLLVASDHLGIGRAARLFEDATRSGAYRLVVEDPPYRLYRRASGESEEGVPRVATPTLR